MDIIKDYDLVLDCTDNVATRYLLNDCCILLKRPLISGSALQMEGQLTVYGYRNGPCYRYGNGHIINFDLELSICCRL